MLCMFFWGHICKSPCHAGCYAAMQVFFRQDLKDLNDLTQMQLSDPDMQDHASILHTVIIFKICMCMHVHVHITYNLHTVYV